MRGSCSFMCQFSGSVEVWLMGLLAGACFRLKCTWAGDLALIKNPPKKEDFP